MSSKQQINLYQARFRKEKVIFSAWQVLRMSFFLVLALVSTSLYTDHQATSLQKDANRMQQQAKKLEGQIFTFGQLVGPDKKRAAAQSFEQLKQIRQSRRQMLSGLSGENKYRPRLFSSYFEGLARRKLDGLWLQEIHISEGGKSIALVGNTLRPELVPKWIKELKNEPAFQGITFRSATLVREQQGDGSLRFSLLTHTTGDGDR